MTALNEGIMDGTAPVKTMPRVIGGRYGLSSKEFTPAMVKAVYDELGKAKPKNHFVVGIIDDVTNASLDVDPAFSTEADDVFRGIFYGLGADGTVGANKNSIKIIGEDTDFYAQGYFVYDSKKSGSTTTSHLRFGPRPIHSTYLITGAKFVACHQWFFLEKFDVLKTALPGSTFLLNSMYGPTEVWDHLPKQIQEQLIQKKIKFYVIDAYKVATETGMGGRVNTIMQTAFCDLGVLERDVSIDQSQKSIRELRRKGDQWYRELPGDRSDSFQLHESGAAKVTIISITMPPVGSDHAPKFVKDVTAQIIAGFGDLLPVSAMPVDGTFPTGTTQWEKRNIALEIPVWDTVTCIQCNKCAMVCPHAAIRTKVYDAGLLAKAPATFKSADYRGPEYKGMKYTVQVAPEDCTGCELCVDVCPAKNKSEVRLKAINMAPQPPIRETERENFEFFLDIPEMDRRQVKVDSVKGSQFLEPLFEFSGACSGCGETPYVKLVSQLFGDRTIVANATGCSSIYGGNLPTTPWAKNKEGRGPAWSNSLFEDNAEFGLGMRLTVDKHAAMAQELVRALAPQLGDDLASALLNAHQADEAGIHEQRQRVAILSRSCRHNRRKPEPVSLATTW